MSGHWRSAQYTAKGVGAWCEILPKDPILIGSTDEIVPIVCQAIGDIPKTVPKRLAICPKYCQWAKGIF
jgi:hypothetical protein